MRAREKQSKRVAREREGERMGERGVEGVREKDAYTRTHTLAGLPSPVGRFSPPPLPLRPPRPLRPPSDPFARRQDRRSMASRSATTARTPPLPSLPPPRRTPPCSYIRIYMCVYIALSRIIPTAPSRGPKCTSHFALHISYRTPGERCARAHSRRHRCRPERVE